MYTIPDPDVICPMHAVHMYPRTKSTATSPQVNAGLDESPVVLKDLVIDCLYGLQTGKKAVRSTE